MYLKPILLIILTLALSFVKAQYTLEWDSQYNGEGDFSDKFTCLASDPDGNVYAAGSTISPGESLNYLVVKYNSSGTELWRIELNAPGDGPDQAKEIVLSNNGNVYVTGYGNGLGTGSDFYTVALNGIGDTLWTRMYNDPAYNQYDEAESIAIDDAGNIYVTGESDSDISGLQNDDYLLVKYSADGTFQWAQRYDGLGGQTDRAVKVLAYNSNSIYVTGRSFNGNDDDFVTIKYNGSGVIQWIQTVDNGGTDRATDMGLDDSGNVYVCGRRDNGNDDDFYIIKYNSAGSALMTKFFDFVGDDRAEAIAVSGDGSFAVTGRSDINPTIAVNFDFYTLSYDSAGTLQWSNAYGGSGNNDDWPVSVDINDQHSVAVCGFVDTDPNALTTSFNMATVLYSSTGTELWSSSVDQAGFDDIGSGVILTPDGGVVSSGYLATAANDYNAALLFHDSNGTDNIIQIEGKGDQTENIRDMVIGSDASIYACGYSVGMETDRNFFVMKMNSTGQVLWADTLSGTMFGSDDEANAIALDPQSNVVVSGYIKNSGSGSDISVRKYTSAGALSWTAIYDGAAHEADRSYDVEVDDSGNIYVTGRTDVDPGLVNNDEIFTVKYSAAGALLWTATHTGIGTEPDRGEFIRILPNGNILVVGRSNIGGDEDIELIVYDPNGIQQWAATYNSGSGSDKPEDVVVSPAGDIYIVGSSEEQPGLFITDAILIKYSQEGALLWIHSYSDAGSNSQAHFAVTLDDLGNVYTGGVSDSDEGIEVNFDTHIMKFNANGEIQWQIDGDFSSGNEDLVDDIIWADDKIFALAHSDVDGSEDVNYDIRIFSVSPDGTLGNLTSYGVSDSSDVGDIIAIQGNSLYVGGSTWNSDEQRNCLVLKYSVFISVDDTDQSDLFHLYPNPASDFICFAAPKISKWTISDMQGRPVLTGQLNNHKIDISALPSGAYVIELVSDTSVIKKTFIKA